MNKLLQQMIQLGDVSDKYLTSLPKGYSVLPKFQGAKGSSQVGKRWYSSVVPDSIENYLEDWFAEDPKKAQEIVATAFTEPEDADEISIDNRNQLLKAMIAYNHGSSATVNKLNTIKQKNINIYGNTDWVNSFSDDEARKYGKKIVLDTDEDFNKEYDSAVQVNPYVKLYDQYYDRELPDYVLDKMKKQAYLESRFRPDAYNVSGATGFTQVKPIALKEFNRLTGKNYKMKDLYNPEIAIEVQYELMKHLYNRPWAMKKSADELKAGGSVLPKFQGSKQSAEVSSNFFSNPVDNILDAINPFQALSGLGKELGKHIVKTVKGSQLNPKNFGLTDYTDDYKTKDEAYRAAPNNSTFLYNGVRYTKDLHRDNRARVERPNPNGEIHPFWKAYKDFAYKRAEELHDSGQDYVRGSERSVDATADRLYNDALDLHHKYGNSKIDFLTDEKSKEEGLEPGRAYFRPGKNLMHISEPVTFGDGSTNFEDVFQDYTSELMHARQLKDLGFQQFVTQQLQDDHRNGLKKYINDDKLYRKFYDERMYDDRLSLEGAHDLQEEPLRNRLIWRDVKSEEGDRKQDFATRANILNNYKYRPLVPYQNQNDIRIVQRALHEADYDLSNSIKKDGTFDGIWGKESKEALKKYQTYHNFVPEVVRFPQKNTPTFNLPGLKKGGPIISSRGQWDYPGQDTIVPTPNGRITMQGVPYPVYGQDETGYGQMMYPGAEYTFPGQMVYEKPLLRRSNKAIANKYIDLDIPKSNPDYGIYINPHLAFSDNHPSFGATVGYNRPRFNVYGKYMEGSPEVGLNIRFEDGGQSDDDREMLDGVADMLRRVKDAKNRKEIANYMMRNFRDENVNFTPKDFLASSNVFADGGQMIRRADGSYSQRGMWDNIRDNKGSGKKPTKAMLEQERKIKAKYR